MEMINFLRIFFDPDHSYGQDIQDFSVMELELLFDVVGFTQAKSMGFCYHYMIFC